MARSSSPLFEIFPGVPGEKTCAIPAGGITAINVQGTCRTIVRPAPTHEPSFTVTFTETWSFECPPGTMCPLRLPLHHTWTFLEGTPVSTPGAPLRILARTQSGLPAPQYND